MVQVFGSSSAEMREKGTKVATSTTFSINMHSTRYSKSSAHVACLYFYCQKFYFFIHFVYSFFFLLFSNNSLKSPKVPKFQIYLFIDFF